MIDFAKIYCKQHPEQCISNFCSYNDCYVGLCPTCLCEHTHQHTFQGTQPQYQNIRSTYSGIHKKMQAQQDLITSDLTRLNKLFKTVKVERDAFRESLQHAKEDCLRYVAECFDELGMHWEKEIQAEEKKQMVHDKYRLDTMATLIKKQMERLIEQTRTINTAGFQDNVKRIEKEVIAQSYSFHRKIQAELEQNQMHTSKLLYKKECLAELKEIIKKILRVQIKMPLPRGGVQTVSTTPEKRINNYSLSHFKPSDNKDSRVSLTSQRESYTAMPVATRFNPSEIGLAIQSVATPKKNASFVTVPRVLTTSKLHLNSSIKPELRISMSNSSCVEKFKENSSAIPQYSYGIDINSYALPDKIQPKSQSKKKSGLMLTTSKNQSILLKQNVEK